MRLLWTCILATGLFLVGLQVYDGRRATSAQGYTPTPAEDGLPYPTPYPTPQPPKTK